jgi:Prophage CP4-57 regulatory protein (AlpA)
MNHAVKAIAHEIKIRRVAYFYSAAERRSRGALWPSFAPALITPCLRHHSFRDDPAKSEKYIRNPLNIRAFLFRCLALSDTGIASTIPHEQGYLLASMGEFPKPVNIGLRSVAWVESEVMRGWRRRLARRGTRARPHECAHQKLQRTKVDSGTMIRESELQRVIEVGTRSVRSRHHRRTTSDPESLR